jgi:hypothetical protein
MGLRPLCAALLALAVAVVAVYDTDAYPLVV